MPLFPDVPLVVIGHRGAAGHLPENTMASFEKAIEMGVHGLELDVQLSADGIPVVIHDPTLDRTTNASGPVGAHTLASLRRLDAGHQFESGGNFPFRDQGHSISTLVEVLDAFRDIPITIELKGESGPNLAHAVADVLADLNAQNRVIVGSFDTSLLKIIRHRLPGVLTNFGNSEVRDIFLLHLIKLHRLGRLPGDVMMLPRRFKNHELATYRFRKATRDLRLEMHIWTVNAPTEMHRMIDLGVDGILTDYPDRLIEIVSARFGEIS